MRADARRNVERIRAAAAEVFAEHGLEASLEEVARRAGVSPGTIYHRFGGREGLIDAAVADLAAENLERALATVHGSTAWERFASYIVAIGEVQAATPHVNAAVVARFPEATELRAVHERAVATGVELMRAAQAEGSLRPDAEPEDIANLIWLNAQALRLDGQWWRRALGYVLDGLHSHS